MVVGPFLPKLDIFALIPFANTTWCRDDDKVKLASKTGNTNIEKGGWCWLTLSFLVGIF